jgi:hypothetical protein
MTTVFSFLPSAKARKNHFTWAISIGRVSLAHGEPARVVKGSSKMGAARRPVVPINWTTLFINWTTLFINFWQDRPPGLYARRSSPESASDLSRRFVSAFFTLGTRLGALSRPLRWALRQRSPARQKIALRSIISLGICADTSSYSRSIFVSKVGGGNGQRHNSVITSAQELSN